MLRLNVLVLIASVVMGLFDFFDRSLFWRQEADTWVFVLVFGALPAVCNVVLRLVTASAVTEFGLRMERKAERKRRRGW